jgi:xylulose-5-phosphate/fructose-6-phosphate phosphoketolase
VLNQLDRFDLALDVIDRVPGLRDRGEPPASGCATGSSSTSHYVRSHGEDLPEVREWQWGSGEGPRQQTAAPSRNAPEG